MSNALIDQDRIRFPGSGSNVSGSTAFGIYDNDVEFVDDCYASMVWASRRLGFPVVDVEMTDINFYACFEEAVNEYGAQVNQFNIRNNLQLFQGQQVSSLVNLSGQNVNGNPLPYVVELSKAYGTEVGVGGYVDWKKGYITTVPFQQNYDLQSLWGNVSESFNRIEIVRIFNERVPAMARIYDPFSMTGMSYSNILNEMGFGAYSPAVQFLMTPIFEDLLRGQAIEFNDMVRKSAFSFEITNNKLKLFPIPQESFRVYFNYMVKNEKFSGSFQSGSAGQFVSDYSNIPYNNIAYGTVNAVGKQWIRKYFLALCKEFLGAVRQKYQTIPIPGAEVTLDGAELRAEAKTEKENLIKEIRENLGELSRKTQMENRAAESEDLQNTLKRVPMPIYIG